MSFQDYDEDALLASFLVDDAPDPDEIDESTLTPARAPTHHKPGSLGKVEELRRRVAAGEYLWHPNDEADLIRPPSFLKFVAASAAGLKPTAVEQNVTYVFDWISAAKAIALRAGTTASILVATSSPKVLGCIYTNGSPSYADYMFLASPAKLWLQFSNGECLECCIKLSESHWSGTTFWPFQALDILSKCKSA